MKVVKRDKVIFHFSPENRPVARVDLGQVFWVETNDCYFGQIRTEEDLRPNIDDRVKNAATGPVDVVGVTSGDVICIEILDIELDSQGVMIAAPGHGVLGDLVREIDTKIIPVRDGKLYFAEDIVLEVEPMVGVIGVSPPKDDVHCAIPGDHGGNMDVKDIKPGSKVYFKVYKEHVGIALGDLHARMGDGEISGSGVEIAGRVKMRVTKAEALDLDLPAVETREEFMVISSEETLPKAIRKGLVLACGLLQQSCKLKFSDAYRLASLVCDVRICQIVNDLVTIRIALPKNLIKPIIWGDFTQ